MDLHTTAAVQQSLISGQADCIPLSVRIGILRQIGNRSVVLKILYESVKQGLGSLAVPNPYAVELLNDICLYLNGGAVTEGQLRDGVEYLRAQSDNAEDSMLQLEYWTVAMFGYAVLSDAATILDIEDYEGEDDNELDPESKSPDYLSSQIFSSAAYLSDTHDPEKSRQFWLGYLVSVAYYAENPGAGLSPMKVADETAMNLPGAVKWQLRTVLTILPHIASGNLPRILRRNILRGIDNPRVSSRIELLCAFRVFSRWCKGGGNRELFYRMLRLAVQCLWHPEQKGRLREAVGPAVKYLIASVDDIAPETYYSGLAAIRASDSLFSDGSDYPDEVSDLDIRPSKWDASYIASQVEGGQSFWKWYLSECIPYAFQCEKPLPEKEGVCVTMPSGSSPDEIKDAERLNRSLSRRVNAPSSVKDMAGLEPYCHNRAVVLAAIASLEKHNPVPLSPGELLSCSGTGFHMYDIVGYWNCVAVVALSGLPEAVSFLERLAALLAEEGPGDIGILNRIISYLPECSHLDGVRRKLEDYYSKVIPAFESYRWFKSAGMTYPGQSEWSVQIRLTSDGRAWAPSAPNGKSHFTLTIDIFSPRTHFYDYTCFNTYQITLRNASGSVKGSWNERDCGLTFEGKELMGGEIYSPVALSILLSRLAWFGIKLDRHPERVYVSRGIDKSHVLRWLDEQLGCDAVSVQPVSFSHESFVRITWPDDNRKYTADSIAGYYVCGRWKSEAEGQGGCFVADLRKSPLSPVLLKKHNISSLVYSAEADYYAALYKFSSGAVIVGGVNPEEADKWGKLCSNILEHNACLEWKGKYVCASDCSSVIIVTMDLRRVEHISSRQMLQLGRRYGFTLDGRGVLYVVLESGERRLLRYDGKGQYTDMSFGMFSTDSFEYGSLPVGGSGGVLFLHELSSGHNFMTGIACLDMDSRLCKVAPLYGTVTGRFRIAALTGDWVIVWRDGYPRPGYCAKLWNRLTGEVVGLRSDWYGGGRLCGIVSLPDGRIVVDLANSTGTSLYCAGDVSALLEEAEPCGSIGYWFNYAGRYPRISFSIPDMSEDASLTSPPPYSPDTERIVHERQEISSAVSTPVTTPGDAGINLCGKALWIRGKRYDVPLSFTAVTSEFGRCRSVICNGQNFITLEDAGIAFVRDEENPYNISAFYLHVSDAPGSPDTFPVLAGIWGEGFMIDGSVPALSDGSLIRSGVFEVKYFPAYGYIEVTIAQSRDLRCCWQHYRTIYADSMKAALSTPMNTKEHLKTRMRYLISALCSGYNMGRSLQYLKRNLITHLSNTAVICCESSCIDKNDMLTVFAACVLLGYEKPNMKRLADRVRLSSVSDPLFDMMAGLPACGETHFEGIKSLIDDKVSDQEAIVEVLSRDFEADKVVLLRDAVLKVEAM